MEENAFKAITIGAAILMTMITITLAMTYYSVVKSSVKTVDDKQDVYKSTEELFYEDLLEMASNNNGEIDGIQARNIIYKLEASKKAKVDLLKTNGMTDVENINKWYEKYTGQMNMIGINEKIKPTDKFRILNLNLDNDGNVSLDLKRI